MSILAGVVAFGPGLPAGETAQPATGWHTAYLTESAILDVAVLADGQAWVVGEAGTILHFDGQSWQPSDSPTGATLHAVTFASREEGWAVGSAGTVLHYDGAAWRVAGALTRATDELRDITLVNGQAWAVGRHYDTIAARYVGLILRSGEAGWERVPMPESEPLSAATFLSAQEGWAVGEAGTVLAWDGVEWIAQNSRTNVDLYDVAAAGDEVWAVGKSGVLVHWREEQFVVELRPFGTLNAVAFAGAGEGWAVGATGTVIRYDGASWSAVSTPLGADLAGLALDAAGVAWVTGDGGLIGRLSAEGWQLATQPYVDAALTAIDMAAATTGWAVGAWPFQPTDGVVFWQPAGDHWNPRHDRATPPLFDVAVLATGEAWAVGQDFRVEDPSMAGVVWRYTSGAWASAGYPGAAALFAVAAPASDDVWAAGQDGSLVHFDGAAWERSPMPENVHLYGLHFRAPEDGWAVGERSGLGGERPGRLAVAFHYDGAGWRETVVPAGPPRLLAVHALSPADVWAMGDAGAIVHYDGEQWTIVQGQQDYHLLDIDLARRDDGWAVGTGGTTLRYDGLAWSRVASPTTESLNGVVSRPWGEAWAVGSNGAFLHHPRIWPWNVNLPHLRR